MLKQSSVVILTLPCPGHGALAVPEPQVRGRCRTVVPCPVRLHLPVPTGRVGIAQAQAGQDGARVTNGRAVRVSIPVG